MCGIIGYAGKRDMVSVLVSALERLSYRGYDSSGIAVMEQGEINVWKKSGKITELKKKIDNLSIVSEIGIGHTRWATHGIANDINAHPHKSQNGKISLIHNGIIENFLELKKELTKENYFFKSETDTEVIANLYQENLQQATDKMAATFQTISLLEGSYSLAILNEDNPDEIVCFRKESPLIIGIGEEENFICSDINVLIYYTKEYIELEENQVAIVKPQEVKIYNQQRELLEKKIRKVDWDSTSSEKGKYDFFMLKEIHEQPLVLKRIISRYIKDENQIAFEKLNFINEQEVIKNLKRFIIQGCGTSWHAGLVGKYWLERFTHILCEIDISSELRYRNYPYQRNDVILALSQSGETADTLACLREAKGAFIKCIGIVNVQGSVIDRESDGSIYSYAGQEIGVASTKNYIAQLMILFLLSLKIGKAKKIIRDENYHHYLEEVKKIPLLVEKILLEEDKIKKIAKKYFEKKGFIFIGRGINYPNALEGALKLKEISYIHATGYAAGELKHGPLALIDPETPVIAIIPQDELYKKNLNNLLEIKARKGKIISLITAKDEEVSKMSDEVIHLPETSEYLNPLLTIVPLQLLSYYIAVYLGRDVDQPKNLAKSVTVE